VRIVIATIGARDLRYPVGDQKWCSLESFSGRVGERVPGIAASLWCEPTLRAISSAILPRAELHQGLRFPILEPALAHVLRTGPIDRLLMIATDQPSKHPNDTVDTAKVLEKLCWVRFGAVIRDIDPGFDVLPAPFSADAYERLRSKMAPVAEEIGHEIFLLPTGGIGKVKDYLRLAAFHLFGLGTRVVEVLPPEPEISGADLGQAAEVFEPFVRESIRQTAIVQINRSDYQGALATLQGFDRHSWPADVLDALARAAGRLNLDFETGGLGHFDSDSVLWNLFGNEPDDAFARSAEVLYLIMLFLDHGRYADAVFRVGLFLEACGWQAALHALGPEFERYALGDRLPVALVTRDHQGLTTKLKNVERPQHDKTCWKLARRSDRDKLFDYVGTKAMNGLRPPTGGPLERLVTLRNDAIHFPTGVTARHIAEALGLPTNSATDITSEIEGLLTPRLKALAEIKCRSLPQNRYPQLNEVLRHRLLTSSLASGTVNPPTGSLQSIAAAQVRR